MAKPNTKQFLAAVSTKENKNKKITIQQKPNNIMGGAAVAMKATSKKMKI